MRAIKYLIFNFDFISRFLHKNREIFFHFIDLCGQNAGNKVLYCPHFLLYCPHFTLLPSFFSRLFRRFKAFFDVLRSFLDVLSLPRPLHLPCAAGFSRFRRFKAFFNVLRPFLDVSSLPRLMCRRLLLFSTARIPVSVPSSSFAMRCRLLSFSTF